MTMLGSSTLPKAMPIPMMAVPQKKAGVPPADRRAIPAAKISRLTVRVFPVPNRMDSFPANGETTAKAIRGTVVISPEIEPERLPERFQREREHS